MTVDTVMKILCGENVKISLQIVGMNTVQQKP